MNNEPFVHPLDSDNFLWSLARHYPTEDFRFEKLVEAASLYLKKGPGNFAKVSENDKFAVVFDSTRLETEFCTGVMGNTVRMLFGPYDQFEDMAELVAYLLVSFCADANSGKFLYTGWMCKVRFVEGILEFELSKHTFGENKLSYSLQLAIDGGSGEYRIYIDGDNGHEHREGNILKNEFSISRRGNYLPLAKVWGIRDDVFEPATYPA